MDKLQIKAIIAGICFGIYPLLLNRSRLSGNLSSAAFCLIVFTCVTPFAMSEVANLKHTYWTMLLGAGALSAVGMLSMTGFLSKVTPIESPPLIVLMIVTQTVMTALYQVILDRGVSLQRSVGFVLAAVAIVLLIKK